MSSEDGLRERKKQLTRRRIADAAVRLFTERGFDAVPVSDVARAAEVSTATVFNYFGTKEALVYSGMEAFGARLVEAVAARPPGASILAAFRQFVVRPGGLLANANPAAMEQIAVVARITSGSAVLQAREREVVDQCTKELATLVARETGAAEDDIEPWVVANALVGVHQAMTRYLHRQLLAGRRDQNLVHDLLTQANNALDILQHGLAEYACRKR